MWSLFFALVGVVCTSLLTKTLMDYPLWNWSVDDLAWVQAWLKMTVIDYYGAALVLSGIAILDEGPCEGLLWSLGFCILGSPVCCVYMVYRILKKKV